MSTILRRLLVYTMVVEYVARGMTTLSLRASLSTRKNGIRVTSSVLKKSLQLNHCAVNEMNVSETSNPFLI